MFIECRHILPSGLKCQSPALRSRPFCYFHSGLRRFSSDGTSGHKEPLILPSLEDLNGIQIALMEVLNAFGHNRIDRRQAAVYLNGLQIATRIAMKTSTLQNPSSVRAITCDDQGGDLAEETTTCEPPHDCLQCTTRDSCQKFEDYEYEVQQLEEQLAEQEEEEQQEEEDARQPATEVPDQQDIEIQAESAEDIEINAVSEEDTEIKPESVEAIEIKAESAPPMKNKACHPERSGLLQRSEGPASSSRDNHQRQEGYGLQREATGSSKKGYRRQPPPMKKRGCHPERSGLLQRSEGPASSSRNDHQRQEGYGLQLEGYGRGVKGTGFSVKGTGFSPYIEPSPLQGGL